MIWIETEETAGFEYKEPEKPQGFKEQRAHVTRMKILKEEDNAPDSTKEA